MLSLTSELADFLKLARAGCNAAASDDEHRAFRLAQAVLDDVPRLDEAVLRGVATFVGYVKMMPNTARDLLASADCDSTESHNSVHSS